MPSAISRSIRCELRRQCTKLTFRAEGVQTGCKALVVLVTSGLLIRSVRT